MKQQAGTAGFSQPESHERVVAWRSQRRQRTEVTINKSLKDARLEPADDGLSVWAHILATEALDEKPSAKVLGHKRFVIEAVTRPKDLAEIEAEKVLDERDALLGRDLGLGGGELCGRGRHRAWFGVSAERRQRRSRSTMMIDRVAQRTFPPRFPPLFRGLGEIKLRSTSSILGRVHKFKPELYSSKCFAKCEHGLLDHLSCSCIARWHPLATPPLTTKLRLKSVDSLMDTCISSPQHMIRLRAPREFIDPESPAASLAPPHRRPSSRATPSPLAQSGAPSRQTTSGPCCRPAPAPRRFWPRRPAPVRR